MKLRYYMRGLGVGIAISTIIMGIINKPETISDEEIKIRASKLGMVEDGVLSKVENDDEKNVNNNVKEQVDDMVMVDANDESVPLEEAINVHNDNAGNESSSVEDIADESIKQIENNNTESQESKVDNQTPNIDYNISNENLESTTEKKESDINEENVENYVVIVIESGNAAQTISKKLVEAGLIESASDYSEYLSLNGYSKMLRVGQHEIPMGADYEKIARILCELD